MTESLGKNTKPIVRCFVALDTPTELKEQVNALIVRLRSAEGGRKVRWVQPDGVHLTLKFLGDVPAEKIPEINAALSSTLSGGGRATFDLTLHGLSHFGKPDAPKVIWLRLKGDRTALNQTQLAVEKALNPLGFPPEARGFNPHLTLGRVPELSREELSTLVSLLNRFADSPEVQFKRFSITEAVLMESDLRPEGAFYIPLVHYPF
jgi:2'-5' RNA ligase